jgi:hypothetical protein
VTNREDEPTLAHLHNDPNLKGWVCWRGLSGTYYARRATMPRNTGYDVKGEDPLDLRDMIIKWTWAHEGEDESAGWAQDEETA